MTVHYTFLNELSRQRREDVAAAVAASRRRSRRRVNSRAKKVGTARRGRPGAIARRVGTLAMLLPAVSLMSVAAPTKAGAAVTSSSMPYWSGVVVEGTNVTAASGDWTVPAVSSYCGSSADLASWVGIGGFGRTYAAYPFAQNGIGRGPTGAIGAWYQVFDKYGRTTVVAVPFIVQPGDTVRFAIRFTADHSHLTFTWANVTRATSRSVTLAQASRWWNGHTVEWINERYPDATGQFPPLLRFTSPITVSNASYSVSGGTVRYSPLRSQTAISMSMSSMVNATVRLARTTYSTSYPRRFSTSWAACS